MALENYTEINNPAQIVGKKNTKSDGGKSNSPGNRKTTGKGKNKKTVKSKKDSATKTNLQEEKEEKQEFEQKMSDLGYNPADLNISGSQDLSLDETSSTVQSMMGDPTSLRGIEAAPYQFDEVSDPRLGGTVVGRKYAEKIYGRLPLLFITPCRPLFMDGFSKSDKQSIMTNLIDKSVDNINEIIEGEGRYYTAQFAYDEYWKYANCMLNAVAIFLGLGNEKFGKTKLSKMSWQKEQSDKFKTFFSSKENLIFYLDGLNSITESFSNGTTESQIASQINGYSDTVREIRYLVGDKSAAASVIDTVGNVTDSVTSALGGVIGNVGGSLVQSVAQSGLHSILNGGKIVFPEMWSDSSFDRSYSIEFKLRSPDNDSYSIFLNVLKPYCKLLALTLPQVSRDQDNVENPNAYSSPFLVKAFSKGLFNIDLGIITSLSATKGAECCWNDDGLPTQIDITIEIKDLYKSLALSGYTGFTALNVVKNTAYMDFVANMAGLNLAQQEMFRKFTMNTYLNGAMFSQIPSRLFTKFDNGISNLLGKLYNFTS